MKRSSICIHWPLYCTSENEKWKCSHRQLGDVLLARQLVLVLHRDETRDQLPLLLAKEFERTLAECVLFGGRDPLKLSLRWRHLSCPAMLLPAVGASATDDLVAFHAWLSTNVARDTLSLRQKTYKDTIVKYFSKNNSALQSERLWVPQEKAPHMPTNG